MKPHLLCIGGVDNHLRIPFLLRMQDRGFRVSSAGSGDAAPFEAAGLDFHPFHFDRFISPLSDWRALGDLVQLLNGLRPDIAHSFDTKPNILLSLAVAKVGRIKVIRTVCGLGWVYSSRSAVALMTRPVLRTMHRIAARTTDATVFEIQHDQDYFEHYRMAGRKRILIPAGGGGIDIEGFELALSRAKSADVLRDELGLGSGPVVITVSRLTRQKGIADLLKAAELVHRTRADVRFLLVGPRESEGPIAISQAEIAQHAPYVVAPGARSDVASLLAMADLFAFPTTHGEGVPRVLLEATIAGLPIVTTDMAGCCEVIQDGKSGFVVPRNNPDAMARRILDVLADPSRARQMQQSADQSVRKTFSLRSIVERHVDVYQTLLRGNETTSLVMKPAA